MLRDLRFARTTNNAAFNHIDGTQFLNGLRRPRQQFRAQATALPKLRSVHETCPENAAIRWIARAVHFCMPSMWRVAYRGIVMMTDTIMLVTTVIALLRSAVQNRDAGIT